MMRIAIVEDEVSAFAFCEEHVLYEPRLLSVLYRYYIGRAGQSVNETVMVARAEQQVRITKPINWVLLLEIVIIQLILTAGLLEKK